MKIIECEYCGNRITYTDKKCPHCGGSVAKVLKEAQAEEEKEQKEKLEEFQKNQKERVNDLLSQFNKTTKPTKIIFYFVFVIALIGILSTIIFSITRSYNFFDTFNEISKESLSRFKQTTSEDDEDEIVTVGLNETAHTEDIDVTLTEMKSYNYVATNENYKTNIVKEGYQQVAFHLQIKNNKNEEYNLVFTDFALLADSYTMEESDVTPGMFATGETFEKLNTSQIPAGGINDGWIGYYVATDKKQLELKIDNNIIIKVDNPYYVSK